MTSFVRCALCFVIVVGSAGCNDAWTKHFENVESANREGLLDKGWIPRFIPPDSKNIVASGDLDSGIVLGSFVSMNYDRVKAKCSKAPDSLSIPSYARRWIGIRDATDSGTLRSNGYEVLMCSSDNFDLADLNREHKFLYWTSDRK